jgi:hypothetical protein
MKTRQSKTTDNGSKDNVNQLFVADKNQASPIPPLFSRTSLIPKKLKVAQESSSEGLDQETRPKLERFLNYSLDNIRIHDNPSAHEASNLIHANAFTTGNHIFMGHGTNSMSPIQRSSLLAHEVVHTIQQNSISPSVLQTKSTIDAPDSVHEREADRIANAFVESQNYGYRSSALQMRSNLRISPVTQPSIQRSVNTWGGEWNTTIYNLVTPATPTGLRGVDIDLTFDPGNNVDAELIGLTQTYRSIKNKKPYFINKDKFYEDRSIKSGDAITVDSNTKETDQGNMIDRVKDYNNPIYPVQSQPSKSLDDTNTSAGWGQNGYHYTDKSGPKHAVAKLIDNPLLNNAEKDSGQIFETTALATKGKQTGTYYGSVRWGWRTDDQANFSKLPLEVISQGVPSSTFMKSAEVWNASKSSTGADTIDLPLVDVKITTAPITGQYPPGFIGPPLQIPAGTRVQILRNATLPSTNGQIRVVDGTFAGITLDVTPSDMASLIDERV